MDTTRETDGVKAVVTAAPPENSAPGVPSWRETLPTLRGKTVLLRELMPGDLESLVGLLSPEDAPRFGIVETWSPSALAAFIERAGHARASGASFTYAITTVAADTLVGLLQVRQLDSTFETAECECLLAPRMRRMNPLLEIGQLAGSFAFEVVGARRLESRVPLYDRRANGVLRKLGAVQEAVLRRSLRRGTEYLDQALWALMKDDWGTVRSAPASRWVH